MTPSTRITEMFGCAHPIQQAGIGGITTPELAVAVARAGAIGMLGGVVGHDALAAQLDAADGASPIGVNFLMPFLDRRAVALAAGRCPLVEFFWATPDAAIVEEARAGGARVSWQVGSVEEAKQARDAGCDVIVLQGVEAGGHVRGTVGLLSLLDRVRAEVDVPLIAAGGIGTGEAMATALAAGADGVRIGTRFVAAAESTAHPYYVDALIAAEADDTVLTTKFGDGWPDAPHRVLRSCILAGENAGAAQSWNPSWPDTTYAKDPSARALYAGRSVAAVRVRATAAEIVRDLVATAEASWARTRKTGPSVRTGGPVSETSGLR
ncbi:MAG TPA: nitronate monooxygenase [Acidimicrobiales bacterium]|nr:nitronate monooxygenase [Acidimicrobiales bacterium]